MSGRDKSILERGATIVVRGIIVVLLGLTALDLSMALGERGDREDEHEADEAAEAVDGWYNTPASRPVAVGDCIDGLTRATWAVVPCAQEHLGEVAGEVRLGPDEFATFPGDDELVLTGARRCLAAVTDYLGGAPTDLGLRYSTIHPTSDTWGQGDRSVWCIVVSQDGTPLLGPARTSTE